MFGTISPTHYSTVIDKCPCEYESLTDPFVTVASAFENGIFYIADEHLEIQINFPQVND